ncbi:hypothetical protein D3C76_1760190 [compost metagenome]
MVFYLMAHHRNGQLRKADAFVGQLLEKELALCKRQPNEALDQVRISFIHVHLKLPQARS